MKELFSLLPDLDEHRAESERELGDYYSGFDPCTEPLLQALSVIPERSPSMSAFEQKSRLYAILADKCPVKLFRHSPFFFEMSSGRGRFSWGGLHSQVGSYLRMKSEKHWIVPYNAAIAADRELGFIHGWSPVGFDHHCLGYDKILTIGFDAIIADARERLNGCTDAHKREFYSCVISAGESLLHLAERFHAEAVRLAELATDADSREHFLRIASASANVPSKPAASFYEGLCAILFCRECIGSLDGIGVSLLGQLDHMLYPLCKADIDSGRLTREGALTLICDLLLYTEIRFDTAHVYHESSTTIELGGCDADGEPIFNELTELIMSAVYNLRSIGTKINCRISKASPERFLKLIAGLQSANIPTLMMHNDDILIPARVRRGQDIRDARLYAGGGCHEIVLAGSEVSTRADTWINLPRILLAVIEKSPELSSFDELCEVFFAAVGAYHERIVSFKNEGERHWSEFSPHVLYSSTIAGTLESGRDITEGGAKYNTTSLSMLGAATLIDSLDALKRLVFEEKSETLASMSQILAANFEGKEELQRHIIHDFPKYGTGDAYMDGFAARVLDKLSRVSGQKNARGGEYLPVFYPHDLFRDLGAKTGATPDGRLAGAPLSRGASPSEFVRTDSPISPIHSLAPIDFTAFADAFCTELTLTRIDDPEKSTEIISAIIRAFLECGGSSLQFNLTDRAQLLEARENPEAHPNLSVRVCGYSARFAVLDEARQDEILTRMER